MSVDFTRPSLFRAILYFLFLYVMFRCREWFCVPLSAAPDETLMPLQQGMTAFFAGHPVWKEIWLFFTSIFCALSITRTLSQNMVYLERTFLPTLLFPLFAFGYTSTSATPVVMTVAFLLVFALGSMMRSYKREGRVGYFFHAAVALGIMPLIYAPAIAFFLLLPIGFGLFRQNWRAILSALLGYLLPLFFCSYVFWGMGRDFDETARQILSHLTSFPPRTVSLEALGVWDYILAGLLLAFTLLAVIRFTVGQPQIRRRAQRGFALFAWTFIIVCGLISSPARSLDLLPLLAVPLAAILPSAVNRKTGWRANLIYLLMLWSILAYNIVHFFYPFFNR